MNVLLHCKRHGIPLVEVPIQTVYLDEHNSASHFHSLRDSWKVLKMLLKFASVSLISFALDYGLFLLLSTATQQFAYGLLCSNFLYVLFVVERKSGRSLESCSYE